MTARMPKMSLLIQRAQILLISQPPVTMKLVRVLGRIPIRSASSDSILLMTTRKSPVLAGTTRDFPEEVTQTGESPLPLSSFKSTAAQSKNLSGFSLLYI